MNIKTCLYWISVLLTVTGCANYNIKYTKTPGTDFTKYQSYAWIPSDSTSGKYINRKHLNDRILFYGNEALAKKGLSVNSTNPDAVFRFSTYTVDKVEYQYNPPPVSVSFGFGGPGYFMGYNPMLAPATVTPRNYKEGTLVIEMLDTRSQQVLWSGEASSVLDNSTDIDNVLKGAINQMMTTLPVRIKTTK
jgi:hypothetical protein